MASQAAKSFLAETFLPAPLSEWSRQVANELFRNADTQEGPQSDIEPKRVSWRERVKAWFASIKQAISK